MRLREIISEAMRNIRTGVGRPVVWAGAVALIIGGVVVVDCRLVVSANQRLADWRDSGASVMVAYAPGGIDGNACERLAHVPGIVGSGAGRLVKDGLALPALPASSPSLVEVTPGFARLVTTAASGSRTERAATPASVAAGGLLLSDSLAAALDRGPGSTLATHQGPARVAGAFAVPGDGRQSPIEYAALAQVPAVGIFDFCWAEVWPPSQTTAALVRSVADPRQPSGDLTVGQLNSTRGIDLELLTLYHGRTTRNAPLVTAVAGLLLGFASIRLRRLELASALHAGVSTGALRLQLVIESSVGIAVAATVASAVVWQAMRQGNPLPVSTAIAPSAISMTLGLAGTAVGVLIGVALTREDHLFRYFKSR